MKSSGTAPCVALALTLALALPRASAAGSAADELARAVAAHPVPGARAGIAVRRLSDGKEIFASGGADLFELASNAKLFTTAAALWKLGPDYEFRTAVIAGGPIEDGTLKGALVIVGGGDPSFSGRNGDVMAAPRRIAQAAADRGIRRISGDLVMDDRMFDRIWRAPGWPEEESLWWYVAPVSALSFNDNCVDVRVAGATAGAAAQISFSPAFPHLRLVNKCITAAKKQESAVTFERNADGSITCGGRIAPGSSRTESIAVENPALYMAAAIRSELSARGIELGGGARLALNDETAGKDAREILALTSRLDAAIAVANRRSQNFYAEQIFKTLGAATRGRGSFETGAAAVADFIEAAHIPKSAAQLVDGCGLSPGNRATPQAVSALLEVAYRSKFRDPFFNSLAVNGDKDTTLRDRLADGAARGRIHAKTGTIKSRGISALSGYAEAPDGEVYAFAILSNGFKPGRLNQVRALEDAVCAVLAGVPDK